MRILVLADDDEPTADAASMAARTVSSTALPPFSSARRDGSCVRREGDDELLDGVLLPLAFLTGGVGSAFCCSLIEYY